MLLKMQEQILIITPNTRLHKIYLLHLVQNQLICMYLSFRNVNKSSSDETLTLLYCHEIRLLLLLSLHLLRPQLIRNRVKIL